MDRLLWHVRLATGSAIGLAIAFGVAVGLGSIPARAAPVFTPFTLAGEDDVSAVAGSALGAYSAFADSFQNRVEIRGASGELVKSISAAEIAALCPWMNLDGGPDGPSGVCFTSTSKSAFVLVHDDTNPSDGLGSDAVLRFDIVTNALTLFARLDLYDRGDQFPHLACAHHKAYLFVGGAPSTGNGTIKVFTSFSSAPTGSIVATWALPSAGPVQGLAVDRDTGTLFAATSSMIYRATLTNTFTTPPTWTLVASVTGVRGLAWADAYGPTATRGLYIVRDNAPAGTRLDFVSALNAYSPAPTTPVLYASTPGLWHSVAARGDGALVLGLSEDAMLVRESTDVLLGFDAWKSNEFAQVVNFGTGLISPDGEPSGWVIDADTTPTQARFHPATPDAAAWTVLLLLANHRVNNDPLAQSRVRTILTRYAGLAADGIVPIRTNDGIFRHWINPATGGVKPGWDPEFATLSTMKIVAAASRANSYFPDDPAIARAASRVIFRTRNWDSYVRPAGNAMYFKGQQAGGPDLSSATTPFHEGVIFVGQAATYGGATAQGVYPAWLNRAALPSAQYLFGYPITSTGTNAFDSAFTSIYPALLVPVYRNDPAWQTQLFNIRWSNAGWTDDNGTRFSTLFSAGTTRSDWGGYRADTLSTHPGNVTTFTSLLGLATHGDANPAAAAYHAYRRGARQTFRSGASILYRRSDLDRTYSPDSAGLPDVALGGLALAELLSPGTTDAILAVADMPRESCPADLTGEGAINLDDLYATVQAPADLNGDGSADQRDARCQMHWVRRWEARAIVARRN